MGVNGQLETIQATMRYLNLSEARLDNKWIYRTLKI